MPQQNIKEVEQNNLLFSGRVIINPTVMATKEDALLITKNKVSFGDPEFLSVKFSDIKEVQMGTIALFSKIVVIKYIDGGSDKEVRFQSTINSLENVFLTKKVYQLILNLWKGEALDKFDLNKMGKVNDFYSKKLKFYDFSTLYGWIKFIIYIVIIVLINYIINILIK